LDRFSSCVEGKTILRSVHFDGVIGAFVDAGTAVSALIGIDNRDVVDGDGIDWAGVLACTASGTLIRIDLGNHYSTLPGELNGRIKAFSMK